MPQHSVNGEVQTTVLENPPTRFYSYDHINDAELADHLESTPGNGAVTVPQGIPNVQAVVPPATGHSDSVQTARPASLESEKFTDDGSALNAAVVVLDQQSQQNEPTGKSCIHEQNGMTFSFLAPSVRSNECVKQFDQTPYYSPWFSARIY